MFYCYKKALLILLLPVMLLAQGVTGSYRLFHVQEARSFEKGRLELFTNMNFWTGTRPTFDDGGTTVPAINIWNNQGNFAGTYGITNHFDATLNVKVYQDANGGGTDANVPSDILLGLKLANYEFSSGMFRWGLNADVLLGVGDAVDLGYETYNPGGFQFGVGALLSYYNDPYLPAKAFSAHLNFGYWSFNDAGVQIRGGQGTSPGSASTVNSTALTYGLGFNFPVDMFDIVLETHGRAFMTQPDQYAYGFENFMYVTPGFKYYVMNWMKINFGVDILVTGKDEETIPPLNEFTLAGDLPNFSSWKVQLGLDFKLMPVSHGASETDMERQKFNDKIDFFENVIEERQRSENIEDELDKLKNQRRQAEKELEELRQLLDEQE